MKLGLRTCGWQCKCLEYFDKLYCCHGNQLCVQMNADNSSCGYWSASKGILNCIGCEVMITHFTSSVVNGCQHHSSQSDKISVGSSHPWSWSKALDVSDGRKLIMGKLGTSKFALISFMLTFSFPDHLKAMHSLLFCSKIAEQEKCAHVPCCVKANFACAHIVLAWLPLNRKR